MQFIAQKTQLQLRAQRLHFSMVRGTQNLWRFRGRTTSTDSGRFLQKLEFYLVFTRGVDALVRSLAKLSREAAPYDSGERFAQEKSLRSTGISQAATPASRNDRIKTETRFSKVLIAVNDASQQSAEAFRLHCDRNEARGALQL
jgi:hypothetical protein